MLDRKKRRPKAIMKIMSKFSHDTDAADNARAMTYLNVFFENSRAKNDHL